MAHAYEEWYKQGKHDDLAQVMALPIMQDALRFLRKAAESNSAVIARIMEGPAADAAMRLALCQASQGGMNEAADMLERLARPPKEKKEIPFESPYQHLSEKYIRDFGLNDLPRQSPDQK